MRLPHLDFVRQAAAVLVVIEHVRAAIFIPFSAVQNANIFVKIFYALTTFGHQAVMIFFALSGFLVGGKAINLVLEGRFDPLIYIIRRLSRLLIVIIPALVFTFLFDTMGGTFGDKAAYDGSLGAVIPSLSKGETVSHGWQAFFGNLFFLQTITVPTYGSNGPLWSLAYEFWYYILGPAIVIALMGRVSLMGKIISAVITLILLIALPHAITILFIVWAAGALAAFAVSHETVKVWVKKFYIAPLLLGPAVVMSVLSLSPSHKVPDLLLGLVFAVALPSLAVIPSPIKIYNRLSYGFAEMSYSLYLVHFPLIVACAAIFIWPTRMAPNPEAFALFFGLVIISVIWGAIVYWMFERHTVKFCLLYTSDAADE